jgi:hypothetical protein
MPVKCHFFDDKINFINEPWVKVELFKPNKWHRALLYSHDLLMSIHVYTIEQPIRKLRFPIGLSPITYNQRREIFSVNGAVII